MTAGARVRFEIRVLGVANAETFHYDDEIPSCVKLPEIGEGAGPPSLTSPWRPTIGIERAGPGTSFALVVHLEPIDCSRLERDFDDEVAALREAGWRT